MSRFVRPDIAAIQGYVPGEQPPPGKFVKLNTNENPYPPSPAVIRAIQVAAGAGLQRYPDPRATAFRMQAGEMLGVDPDWILCGNGSDELLTIAIRTFVGAGQVVRFPTPGYVLYETLAGLQGARFEAIPFTADWQLPLHFADVTRDVRLVVVANPNSPSGTLVTSAEVSELASRVQCPVLVDEAYVDFSDANCLHLVTNHDNVLVSRSLSKSYALAGLRCGFLIARPPLINEMFKLKDSYNCSALAIAGATAAIAEQSWLQSTRQRILSTRARLANELAQLGFQVAPSQANFLWCTRADCPVQPLFETLKSNQILVRYMRYPNWGDGLRISVGTDEQIDALLAVLRILV